MAEAGTLGFAVWPQAGSSVSVATYLKEIVALARIRQSPPPFPEDAARGRGQPVLVLPGFCAPDDSTARLREFLNRQGFAARPWECGPNLGPTRTALRGFEKLLAETADKHGEHVALVGISLGGVIAREIAKRHPDRVSRVVTLVSPIRLPVTTPLAPLARFASLVWDDGARATFGQIAEPPPVPLTAIVNPLDGVVDWHACVPDPAPGVETMLVEGAHMTMGSNPEAQRVVASRLAAEIG
jgi:pimeloyl-ACP methyl ester carboxylesterase